MIIVILVVAAVALSWANGANDTGKPVASLVACGAMTERTALRWAAAAGLVGSLTAVWLGADLARLFTGTGVIDDPTRQLAIFAPAVAGGAAIAISLASRFGLPVSTTHALLGALVGTGLVLNGTVHWSAVGGRFILPLVLSPVLAMAVSLALGAMVRRYSRSVGRSCACTVVAATPNGQTMSSLVLGDVRSCSTASAVPVATGAGLGRWLHIGSGLAIAGARGLNDTPKIAALILPITVLIPMGGSAAIAGIGLAIALGGWFAGRQVMRVMATKLVSLEGKEAESGSANLTAAAVILAASPIGLPVSTTHVTTGALVGAGALAGGLSWRWLGGILAAWVTTLPVAAVAAAGAAILLRAGW
jgi:PiT family inorganic phosphate transporter